jgi:hypothetical protein
LTEAIIGTDLLDGFPLLEARRLSFSNRPILRRQMRNNLPLRVVEHRVSDYRSREIGYRQA